MLTQKDKDHFKKVFKLDVDKLIAAVTAPAEVALENLPDGTLLTADELTARDTNKINEGKVAGKTEGEVEGETKGVNLVKKELKAKLGIELKGERWGHIANELKTALDATTDQKVILLQDQVKLLTTDKDALTGKVTAAEQLETTRAFNDTLINMFPDNILPGLKPKQRLMLMNADITWEKQADGAMVAKRNGEVLRNAASQTPLPPKDVIKTYFTESSWIDDGKGNGGPGGRGGGNSGGGTGTAGIKKMTAFKEAWIAENPGKNANGTEFDAAIQLHTKDMTDFNWLD